MTDSHAHHDHVPWGTFRSRPELERLLTELHHMPPGETGQAQRWRRWRIAAANVLQYLEETEAVLARDPHLTATLPPGVGGRTNAEAVADFLRLTVGELLYESHESCRRLYDCSTPELDTIVAAARRAGALGARLTGAGWGGAVLVLLGRGEGGRGRSEARVVREIQRAFAEAYGREPAISRVRPSGGVRRERVR